MAKKNVGRLAGLAALGAAAYMMSKGKDTTGPAATAGDQKTSNYTGADKRVSASDKDESPTADAKTKSDVLSAITKPKDKSNDAAGNDGVISAPVNKSNAETRSLSTKVDDDKKADESVKEVEGGDPSQSKGVLRSDKDMTQAEAKTILNQTPADKAKQAAQDKKDIASNKADFRAYQRNLDAAKVANLKSKAESQARKADARKASISTDEMKNRSRAQAAYDAKMKRLKANPESQAVEGVYPEQYLTPGAKVVSAAAKNLANRGSQKLAGDAAEGVLSPAGQRLKDVAQLREKMFPGRDATVTNPNAWAAGPKGMEKIRQAESRAAAAEARAAAAEAKRNAKDPLMSFKPGSDFKRGGAVKMASGGMTASRRGDGIASRGKTRCKMY